MVRVDVVTYELTRITKVSTQCYFGINTLLLLFCDYIMNIFLFQTSSLSKLLCLFFFGSVSLDRTHLIFFNLLKYNSSQ